jgi:hypothetical protein
MPLITSEFLAKSREKSFGTGSDRPPNPKRSRELSRDSQTERCGDGSGRRPAARIVPILHAFQKASRASPCSRCWSAPNWQVAIFCFASTAKHGPAGKSTIRAAARNAQRDMLNPPNPLNLQIHIKAKNWHQKLAPNAIKSPGTLRHDHFRVNA